jgi:hypothetical protein
VAAVMGCYTSASRKAVLPVFEAQGLLYYPTYYEGLEHPQHPVHRPGDPVSHRSHGMAVQEQGQDLLHDRVHYIGADDDRITKVT